MIQLIIEGITGVIVAGAFIGAALTITGVAKLVYKLVR